MRKDEKPYRILIIEDNAGDLVIVEDFLSERMENLLTVNAANFKQAHETLNSPGQTFDVILLDLSLPDKSGDMLIKEVLNLCGISPVIILTGTNNIDFSIKSIALGVSDYLVKEELSAGMLYKSIVYAIERKKTTAQLQQSEKQYSELFELSPQPMCLYEPLTFKFTHISKAAIEHYGYTREEFLNMTLLDLILPDDIPKTIERIVQQKRELNKTYANQVKSFKKAGTPIDVETFSTPLIIDGRHCTLLIAIDITEKNLYEHNLMKAIIKTQEDERYEIGGELHDNICQLLATSQIYLNLIKSKLAEKELGIFEKGHLFITRAMEEIRNLSHRLAPAFFDDTTLEAAFYLLLSTFNEDKKYKVSFSFDNTLKECKLDREFQLNLYRIVQEQLRNIQKYAQATMIELTLRIDNNHLLMCIADNGKGFDKSKIKSGIGLANMRRRTELFAGKLDVISSPGNGCIIEVSIPYDCAGKK